MRFGVGDDQLAQLVAAILPAPEVLDACDICLLPKPVPDDFERLREGQVLWGWPHCVQDAAITQTAIDRKLTLIAWEAMNLWDDEGRYSEHIFTRNNEMAGYCSVLHAMQLMGTTGAFGPPLRAAVISLGATARGAVTGLRALGIHDITVLTRRSVSAVPPPLPDVTIAHYERDPEHSGRTIVFTHAGQVPLAEYVSGCDVVVNCIYQDTDAPITFITMDELSMVEPGALIVDVSCDEGMGFEWARPTTFDDPIVTLGGGSITTPWITVRAICGTRPPGRSAMRCCPICRLSWPGRRLGGGRDDQAGCRDPGRRDPQPEDPDLPGPLAGLTRTAACDATAHAAPSAVDGLTRHRHVKDDPATIVSRWNTSW